KSLSTPVADNSQRAAAYGIPGEFIPENDPVAIYEATKKAVDRARRGEGPSLIEIRTDRMMGHFEGDPQAYRSKEEYDAVRTRDPILVFKENLLRSNVITDKDVQGFTQAALAEVNAAVEYALESPYPAPESALQHVFA